MIKKWLRMLVLPYVVTVSTYQEQSFDDNWHPVEKTIKSYEVSNFPIAFREDQRDLAEDMAEALNAAHERRIENTFCTCPNGEEVDCMHGGSCK